MIKLIKNVGGIHYNIRVEESTETQKKTVDIYLGHNDTVLKGRVLVCGDDPLRLLQDAIDSLKHNNTQSPKVYKSTKIN